MQTLRKITATLAVVGAVGITGVIPASADWYGHHHRYYNYYGSGGFHSGNGCRPGWTVQGGVCKPYRYGPWDISASAAFFLGAPPILLHHALHRWRLRILRYVTQLTFPHDPLMWFVGAFHAVLKLAVAFWQFSCDGACASCNF